MMVVVRRLRRVLIGATLVLSAVAAPLATPASAAGCQFVLGFAALQGTIPNVVGQCLEDEQHNPDNGDALQHTTKGLLVWRKADNATAFTNGYQSWIQGPHGLEVRLDSQRFPWEANPSGLLVVPDSPVQQAAVGITNADTGKTFQVNVGTFIDVSLRAGSGMQNWQLAPTDASILMPVVNPAAAAARGVTLRSFKAVGPGTAVIRATDRPACSPQQACPQFIQAFVVTVAVSSSS